LPGGKNTHTQKHTHTNTHTHTNSCSEWPFLSWCVQICSAPSRHLGIAIKDLTSGQYAERECPCRGYFASVKGKWQMAAFSKTFNLLLHVGHQHQHHKNDDPKEWIKVSSAHTHTHTHTHKGNQSRCSCLDNENTAAPAPAPATKAPKKVWVNQVVISDEDSGESLKVHQLRQNNITLLSVWLAQMIQRLKEPRFRRF